MFQVSGLPMLSSLDMDYYQIQGLFLYKLRDPLVSNELKIAIVEFITTCVHTQHALTAALFNITYDQKGTWTKQTDSASDESVTQFFMEYLYNIKKVKLIVIVLSMTKYFTFSRLIICIVLCRRRF